MSVHIFSRKNRPQHGVLYGGMTFCEQWKVRLKMNKSGIYRRRLKLIWPKKSPLSNAQEGLSQMSRNQLFSPEYDWNIAIFKGSDEKNGQNLEIVHSKKGMKGGSKTDPRGSTYRQNTLENIIPEYATFLMLFQSPGSKRYPYQRNSYDSKVMRRIYT